MNENNKSEKYEYSKIPTKEKITEIEKNASKFGFGIRHIQLALFFICLTVNIIGRGHMGVTIVAMTTHKNERNESTNRLNITLDTKLSKDDTNSLIGENQDTLQIELKQKDIEVTSIEKINNGPMIYDWPKSVQEMVLNSFFLGYLIMMFPIGMVCQRYGGKLPLQITLIVNGIASLITPQLTVWGGWKAVCCCRILQGLSQAGTYPSIQALLAKWTSTCERASHSCIVYTGITLGTVVAYQIAGFLGASTWGWPSTFYTIGVIYILSFILLTFFGAATPLEHKSITDEEKNYIIEKSNDGNYKKLKTPWRAIIRSKPLWAVFITQAGSGVTFVFFFNQVPSYIHHVLGVNVVDSGLLSSLPYAASFFTSLGFGWLSDYCTNRKIVSMKNARRISNSISQCGAAVSLMLTSYTNNTIVAVTTLVVAMAVYMGLHTGWMINTIDLSPNFSGTSMAIGGTITNIFIVATPIIVSYVVTDMTNVIQWRIMFFIIAGICLITNAIFVIFLSTDIQPWNYANNNETCIEKQEEK